METWSGSQAIILMVVRGTSRRMRAREAMEEGTLGGRGPPPLGIEYIQVHERQGAWVKPDGS